MVLNPKGQRINREEEELEPDDVFFELTEFGKTYSKLLLIMTPVLVTWTTV